MKWQSLTTVSLPVELTVADLLGVVEQMEQQVNSLRTGTSAAHGVPQRAEFPRPVEASLVRLLAARDTLRALEARRAPAAPAGDPVVQGARNTTLDDAWRAMDAGLRGATFLTDAVTPGRDEATSLHAAVFGSEGLHFVNLRPMRQWHASVRRLAVLEEAEGRDGLLTALALTRHFAALRAAHAAFGEAYGFLAAQHPGAAGVTDTRAAQGATEAALREFLFKVSAQADADEPGSEVWVGYVLAPYAELLADLARVGAARRASTPAQGGEAKPPVV